MTCRRTDGYVYFFRAVGRPWIKIGWAQDPIRRVSEVQCGCPDFLEILFVMRGTPALERATRHALVGTAGRGEWKWFGSEAQELLRRLRHDPENGADTVAHFSAERCYAFVVRTEAAIAHASSSLANLEPPVVAIRAVKWPKLYHDAAAYLGKPLPFSSAGHAV